MLYKYKYIRTKKGENKLVTRIIVCVETRCNKLDYTLFKCKQKFFVCTHMCELF